MSIRSMTARYLAVAACIGLGACSTSPLSPDNEHPVMRVGAPAMTATTLGQNITIDAAVVTASGARIPGAEVAWDLNATGVLESTGGGHFRVLHEGTVQVAAVWPKDPSVRAVVTVKVDASILASACITHSDQAAGSQTPKCAQRRLIVSASTASPTLASMNAAQVTSFGAQR